MQSDKSKAGPKDRPKQQPMYARATTETKRATKRKERRETLTELLKLNCHRVPPLPAVPPALSVVAFSVPAVALFWVVAAGGAGIGIGSSS